MSQRNFFAELKRRNVYKVAVAYAVVAWLLIQAASILFPTYEAPAWVMKVFVALIIAGFPIALILAWAFEITPEGIVRAEDVPPKKSITRRSGKKLVAMTVVLALIAAGLFFFQLTRHPTGAFLAPKDAAAEKSIAVLPFVNMSSDKENEYFVDGLTEEILNRLSQIAALKVPGRTSSFVFKGKNTDLRQVGSGLGVANVLEGSVRKAGERLRITAQLVRTADGYHLWSQVYDRKLDDVFAIQEEIARSIANALAVQLKLSGGGIPERPTQDMTAYSDYLEARALITQRTSENLRRAVTLLEGAVQRDPTFGRAWAALAEARALAMYYGAPIDFALRGAEEAARKALAIDDSIGLAHSALADVLRDRRDWIASEREFRRALELSPSEGETHNQYAQMLLKVGHLDEALEHAKRACELDPLAWVPPSIVAAVELSRKDLPEARTWLDRNLKVRGKADGFALRLELIYALAQNDAPQARDVLATARTSAYPEWSSPADQQFIGVMDQVLAHAADPTQAPIDLRRALQEANVGGIPDLPNEIADVLAFANEPALALEVLEAEMRFAGGDPAWIWMPPLRRLWTEPRFHELLKTLKLPDYWRVAGWPTFCHPKGANDFECSDK
jgi:TolB-like protein/Tfp pilus assembly protein PilF